MEANYKTTLFLVGSQVLKLNSLDRFFIFKFFFVFCVFVFQTAVGLNCSDTLTVGQPREKSAGEGAGRAAVPGPSEPAVQPAGSRAAGLQAAGVKPACLPGEGMATVPDLPAWLGRESASPAAHALLPASGGGVPVPLG